MPLASDMAWGSCACTLTPFSISLGRMDSAGASRMSSVSGLKARPSTARVLPLSLPPRALRILLIMRAFCASFTSITASTMRLVTLFSWAMRTSARVSLGKQEPP